MASKRRTKGRSKRKAPAKKPRKTMAAAARKAVRKSARRGAKRVAKPAGKHAAKRVFKAVRVPTAPIMIPIKTETAMPAEPTAPAAMSMPSLPFGYGRDSIMNMLAIMLILIAVISAGIFFPQIKAPNQAPADAVPGAMQHK